MDNETGESCRDLETGEVSSQGVVNCETGEVEMNYTRPTYKKPFQVPSSCKPKPPASSNEHNAALRDYMSHTKRVSVAPAFAILTLLFFVPVFGIFISIIEFFIHMWTHKKNKKLRNTNLYYRSPFHDIICEFCSFCIDENTTNKITKLQDKRNDKFTKYGIEYVRRIVT